MVPALLRWIISAAVAGAGLDQRKTAVGAEDADGGVESVGVEAVPGNDGDRDVVDETHPGRGVDDVGKRRPSTSTCCSLLPEVETAAFVSSNIAGTPGKGSPAWTPMRQPRCPGAPR